MRGAPATRIAPLVAAVTVLLAASCAGPPPRLPAGAVPILFVHGHGAHPDVFEDMIGHFEDRGYPPEMLLAVDLTENGPNAESAERVIAPAVEELVVRTGGGPTGRIDIVAHSMGALSSRWYTARVRPDRVRTLLTVGGANHGTDVLCGDPYPGGRELCPAFARGDNPVQVGLNGVPGVPVDETPFGRAADPAGVPAVPPEAGTTIRYVAVLVPGDEWIVPLASSELAGADPVHALPAAVAVEQFRPGNLLFGEPTDHDAILADDRFFVLLDAVLSAPGDR
jgi:pimeloyl-ACP methyl ester carboxylesterase